MTTRNVILLVGLLLVGAGLFFTFEQYSKQQENRMAIESVSECSSCTRRHQAYARTKKSLEKSRLTPIVEPD